MKSLKDQIRDLELDRSKDFDPEDDVPPADSDESSIDGDKNDFDGREHYEKVEKSRLRKPAQEPLGPKYEGVAVSRDALDEDASDAFAPVDEEGDEDPFAENDNGDSMSSSLDAETVERATEGVILDGTDEEIDSDEAFGDSDEGKFLGFRFRGSKRRNQKHTPREEDDNLESDSDVEENLSDGQSDPPMDDREPGAAASQDSDVSMNSDEYGEEDSDGSSTSHAASPAAMLHPDAEKSKLETFATDRHTTDRSKLKALASQDATFVSAALSGAASADVNKGVAVKQQRQTYDRLLDARIKLQKGLTTSHELTGDMIADVKVAEAVKKAEEAVLALWSTIDLIRCDIANSQGPTAVKKGKKRKQTLNPTLQTPLDDLWRQSQSLESLALPHRRTVLNKWSSKTRSGTTTASRSRLDKSQKAESAISDVLDTYLATESSKLISTSSEINMQSDPPNYDDTNFYQSLLRDLIASRTSTNNEIGSLPSTKLHPSSLKTKKVDTKASKGRKVRYTVHEKLLNFMAAEDRRTWEERASTEFFGSLFGNRRALEEDKVEVEEDGVNVEDGKKEEAALRLFRS